MENTAVVELFGSFFVSLASQQDNKEELLKHFSNFKCALYSQQGNKTSDEVNRYLDSLEKQVTKQTKGARLNEAVEKFEKNNRAIYGSIQKLSRKEKAGRFVRGDEPRPVTQYQRKPSQILQFPEAVEDRRSKFIPALPLTDRQRLTTRQRSDHQLRYV